ncbi:hypothetical protein T440DRAFT_177351 [Plenodomus tracheiphilus IPT5]|uniref:ADF-H domain-containing protein n=1 Tax=Plenodomus tracheiphilus IPT5 TaxID=1408161 RepID=A0A6A7B153_9PLEO|nr:hypothetical protein T440DRAFT_177351 [Plenodomus tracheiphilus IPT5]
MSLNGLDSVAVTQAYQSALAEAGGWFLLRYTSRDAVEVLTRGTGGAGEARVAVAQYEDKSPLYGLLLYRRRKVLVKYVPEGTSRLLQARVAVHFLTITDRFAPHDIVLNITTPEELSDAALTAACTLHTAAPSSSSSSGSSRQQKLSWIQEAAEEGNNNTGEDSAAALRPTTAKSVIPTILEPRSSNEDDTLRNGSVASQAETVPLILEERAAEAKPVLAPASIPLPERSHVPAAVVPEVPMTPPEADLSDLQATLQSYDRLFEGGPEPRLSSQTARPNYNELYEHYYAQYTKPKVKLGPRPRPSLDGRRPSTSGSASQDIARPVSSLPSGLRSATRKATGKKESKTRTSSAVPTIAIPPPPPIPMTPDMPHSPVSPGYSMRIPASVKSMPVSAYSSHHRATGMTQEKTRLMKALELRKKQQKAQEAKKEKLSAAAATSELPAETIAPEGATKASPGVTDSETKTTPDSGEEVPVAQDESPKPGDAINLSEEDMSSSSGLDNSGLAFTESQTEGDDLNSAASISSPISAQTQVSSGSPSTRPSSLSDNEDSTMKTSQKSEDDSATHGPDSLDEGQSVDSTPTVVPESRTPVPSVALDSQVPQTTVTDSSIFDRHASGLTLPAEEEDDARARRRSKRESRIYMPPGDVFQYEEAPKKKANKESMLMPTSKRQSWYETKEKRRALLDPLEVSAEHSETEYLSDDSFMEELQSATVHQAQPMSVSKSPITPFFSRKSSAGNMTPPGTASTYRSIGGGSPEHLVRKASGGWPPRPSTSDTVVVAKKINVSSGISQRIKALAEKSSRELKQTPGGANGNSLEPGSTLAQRKSSFFAASPIETWPSGQSSARLGSPSILTSSASSPSDKKRQPGPVKSTIYNVRGAEKPESVQVTARIIRDERTAKPTLAMPTESTPLELHQSPLIIDHQKPTWTPKSPTRGRPETASPRAPPSSSHSREQSIAPSRTSSESTWRAFGRRMSETKSIHSHEGGDDRSEDRKEKKDKKDSRTSKMFKRMSSSMPWKNSSSNLGLPEQGLGSSSLFSLREPPSPVHVGDLNIQFPDTLLWKRRYVEIDASGNLVLSPSRSNEKGVVKRFHLSEFRAPYLPDQDRQELPNSVVLDFVDGRTLQCACETYIAQAQVLQILTEAHDAWLAYGQAA